MDFLVGAKLDKAIREWAISTDPCCAVAFLGNRAAKLFPKTGPRVRIICNLTSGGTNPHEVRRLREEKHDIRQNDHLHAKVYFGGGRAIVASANMSANGLGLEGSELANWIEAGMVTDNIEPIKTWFEQLWGRRATRKISDSDIDLAIQNWRPRRSTKPQLGSFSDFDPTADDFPLLCPWDDDTQYGVNAKEIEAQLHRIDENAIAMIHNSIDLDHESELEFMYPGRWVIWWKQGADNMPVQNAPLEWGRIRDMDPVRNGFYYETGLNKDCVLLDDQASPIPFSVNDGKFTSLFDSLLRKDDFSRLRTSEPNKPYYGKRIKKLRKFWIQLRENYN